MRLFLALVPPPALRRRLGTLADAAQARCGGRRMPDDDLHLTLAFLGERSSAQATALADWLPGIVPSPGHWRLDRWGQFRRPGIIWVGGVVPEPALSVLQQRLWDGLERLGIDGRPARFVPHVTLLRRATHPPDSGLPAIELSWAYARVELIQSDVTPGGSHYRRLASTPPGEED
ncbi:RNA 2',3'-cyclic phosphodiesterase [Halomonas borealis]|uniref:RNA 2',3'-cyclic phosphodiesterase n=1 Tax=Halomonas borealis TaxID=2508710 RepID=UPI00109F1EBC|nr:RNA 2',3'-cyclic phosphodiesterase [Halomonas borealis]